MGKTSGPAAKVTLQPPREQQPRHRTAASAANPVREPGGRPGNLRGDAVSPGGCSPRAMGGTGHPDVPRSRGCAAGLCGQRGQSSARLCAARPQPLHLSGDPRAGTAPSPARTQPATRHREPRGSRVGPRRAPPVQPTQSPPAARPRGSGPCRQSPAPRSRRTAGPGAARPQCARPAPSRAASAGAGPDAMRCRALPGDQARGAARPPGPQHAAARGCGPAGAAGGAAAAGPPHRVKAAAAAAARPGSATKGPARHRSAPLGPSKWGWGPTHRPTRPPPIAAHGPAVPPSEPHIPAGSSRSSPCEQHPQPHSASSRPLPTAPGIPRPSAPSTTLSTAPVTPPPPPSTPGLQPRSLLGSTLVPRAQGGCVRTPPRPVCTAARTLCICFCGCPQARRTLGPLRPQRAERVKCSFSKTAPVPAGMEISNSFLAVLARQRLLAPSRRSSPLARGAALRCGAVRSPGSLQQQLSAGSKEGTWGGAPRLSSPGGFCLSSAPADPR